MIKGGMKDVREAQGAVKDISEMLVFDNPNAYIPMLNFGGKTLRRGERGVTTTSYFQLQGVGQDISAASYSMAAKFIFSKYVSGKGQMASLISAATRNLGTASEDLDDIGVLLRNSTSQLHALKTSRKYSRGTSEVNATLQGDAVAAMIIEARQTRLAEIGWQPVDSLFSNMFWESMDKAKTQMGQRNYVNFLSKLAKGDRGVLGVFADLMGTDLFGNMMRHSSIKNITFFTKGFKKAKKGRAEGSVGELASMWQRTDTIGVQMEMQLATESKLLQGITRNVIEPITSSGIVQMMPGWLKSSASLAGGVFATAWSLQQLAAMSRVKDTEELLQDMGTTFNKLSGGSRKGIQLSIDDPEAILKAYTKRFENTKFTLDKAWGAEGRGQGRIMVINKGDNSKLYLGITDLGMSPGQHSFIHFGEVLDYMTEDQIQDYLQKVESHGATTKSMFTGLEVPGTNEVSSIQDILLNRDRIGKTLETNLESARGAHKASGATVSELLENAGGSKAVVHEAIVRKGVKDFAETVAQSVDKVLNSGDLTKIVEVDVLGTGKPQKFYVYEVMQHGDDVEKLKALARETVEDPSRLAARKDGFDRSAMRKKVMDQVEEVVTQEYGKAQWSATGNIADDVGTVSEVNARALSRLTEDSSELAGLRGSAGGTIQVEDIGRTESRRAAAKAAAKKPQVVRKAGGVLEVVMEEGQDALHFQRATHAIDSIPVQFYKGLSQTMNVAFSIGDVVQGIDLYAAYARVGEAYASPYATTLDKDLASRELGRAFMMNMLGLGLGAGLGKLSGGIMAKFGEMQKNKTLLGNLVKGGAILGGSAAFLAATWKNVAEPIGRTMGNFFEEHQVGSNIKKGWDTLWYGASDFSGRVLAAPIGWAAQAGAPAPVLRGMAHGAGAAMGTGLILAGLAVSGIVTMGLLPALAVAAGVGAIVGIGAMMFGEDMTAGANMFISDIKNVPYVGGILGGTVTEPHRQIRNQARFRHHFHNSPFLQGYIGDLINSQWLNVVGAAEDATGRDMVSFMYGEVLYPADYDTSAWRKNAADSAIGSPPALIDAVISNELKIRADHYSATVIGRYSWDTIVEHADNNNVIRAREEAVRAEKAAQIDRAHANAKKALLAQGGPQVALNAGSGRTAAVTQQQIANVEKFNAVLTAAQEPSTQVTAVTVAMHKSDVMDSNQEQAEQAKTLSLGPIAAATAPPLSLKHQYTQRVYTDDNVMAVAIEKGTHDSNPMLQADSRAFSGDVETVAKVNSPEMKSAGESYNLYKDNA